VANGAGLRAASSTWIAKVDADDLSLPHRFETQLAALAETGADLCGAAMWEFDDDPERPTRLRTNPVTHEAIARRMRFNNPINHPTAMYRRELALQVGGYPAMRFMQDYDLMARLLAGGARMTNLEEPLVLFRAGDGMLRRRSARGYLSLERQLQRNLRSYGLVGRGRAALNLTIRGAFRVLPRWGLSRAYARFLLDLDPKTQVLKNPDECLNDLEAVMVKGPYTADLFYKAALVLVTAKPGNEEYCVRAVNWLREAVKLGRDLLPAEAPFTAEWMGEAVEAYYSAIEIVDDRYQKWQTLGAPTLVADDFFAAGCVLGLPVARSAAPDLLKVAGSALINGKEEGRGTGADVLGHPHNALAWLTNHLAAEGRGLHAGQIVLTGSLVKTVWLKAGDHVRMELDGLGEVAVTFT
jgi:hypothetical protein